MDIRITERSLNGRSRWLVANGFKGHREGYRAVVVDGVGSVRSVDRCDRNGAEARMCTYQIAYDGDYILSRSNGDEWITTRRLDCGNLVKVNESERRSVMQSTALTLEEWLEDDSFGKSYLPEGFGWDGHRTGSEISKFERCEKFFLRSRVPVEVRNLVKPYILESRGFELCTSWKKAERFPTILSRGSTWVLWTTNNKPVILEATIEYPLPYNLEKAMQITIDYEKYNVKWNLFLRNK